jgi:hypothetical protein
MPRRPPCGGRVSLGSPPREADPDIPTGGNLSHAIDA